MDAGLDIAQVLAVKEQLPARVAAIEVVRNMGIDQCVAIGRSLADRHVVLALVTDGAKRGAPAAVVPAQVRPEATGRDPWDVAATVEGGAYLIAKHTQVKRIAAIVDQVRGCFRFETTEARIRLGPLAHGQVVLDLSGVAEVDEAVEARLVCGSLGI